MTNIIPGLRPDPYQRSTQARPPTGGQRPIIRATILPAAPDGLRALQTATGQPHLAKVPVTHRSLLNVQHKQQLRHSPHEVFMADSFPTDVTRYRTLVQANKKGHKISIPTKDQPKPSTTPLAGHQTSHHTKLGMATLPNHNPLLLPSTNRIFNINCLVVILNHAIKESSRCTPYISHTYLNPNT